MNEYTILQTILLGFLTHNDSYDSIIGPEDGHLKFDGSDIIFVDRNDKEHLSHTTNNAIDIWLEQGKLELKHENMKVNL